MPLLAFVSPLFHYHTLPIGPQTYYLNPEEFSHHFRRIKEGNQGSTGSLNPQDDSKEPTIKQTRTLSLSRAFLVQSL